MILKPKQIRSPYINRSASWLRGFVSLSLALLVGLGFLLSSQKAAWAEDKQALVNQKVEEITQLQNEISSYREVIRQKQYQKKTLQDEMSLFDSQIAQNVLEVKRTQLDLERNQKELQTLQEGIRQQNARIEQNKTHLRSLLQSLHAAEQHSFLEVLVFNNSLSDFFNDIYATENLHASVTNLLGKLKTEKENLANQNQVLEKAQEDGRNLLEAKKAQNDSLESFKRQKSELIALTNGDEARYQEMLRQNQSALPSLQAELRSLQSLGQSIALGDAVSVAKSVGEKTGVRPALLLGVLKVESGLGTNVGGGNYLVDMSPSQRSTFEEITRELGYDPRKMPVSKKPTAYTGWGGAMGPAQMMPTTWRIYDKEVAKITGHAPADPWNLTDAVTAMALKLAAVDGVKAKDRNAEYKAAGMYLAGSNWQRFLFYPDKVMYYADLYEKQL